MKTLVALKDHAGTNRSQEQDSQVNSEQARLFPG